MKNSYSFVRFIVLIGFFFFSEKVSSQDEYLGEIGIGGGSAFYLGDANSELFNHSTITYSGIFRYRFNPRIDLRAEWNYNLIEGKYKEEANPENIISFNNDINALDICGEFNFFDYEQKSSSRSSRRYTTYIFAGLGAAIYSNDTQNTTCKLAIPFGVGFKVKISSRWNFNTQWGFRWISADDIEAQKPLNNYYQLNGSNPFNKDFVSTLMVGLTFDFLKKPCDCKMTTH